MMRDGHACPACACGSLWHIPEVLERDVTIERMAVWLPPEGEGIGSFELFLCATCGLAEWWAHGLGAEPPWGAQVVEEDQPCAHCSGRKAIRIAMEDHVSGGRAVPMVATMRHGIPETWLVALICADCGHTRWRATPPERIRGNGTPGEMCRACGATDVVMAPSEDATVQIGRNDFRPEPSATEFAPRSLAAWMGFWGPRHRGRVELRVCPRCAHVDWIGRSLDELVEDRAAGVELLHAKSPVGPYR